MKRKFLILTVMLAVMSWATMASAVCSFDLTAINDPTLGPGPYVHVDVTWTSSTTATILATAYDGFKMGDGGSFAANFNGPVAISDIKFYDPKTSIVEVTPGLPVQGPNPNQNTGYLQNSGGNVDGWGTFSTIFNVASYNAADNFDVITFLVTLTEGSWANCADVVASGVYPFAAHVQNQTTLKTGYATVPLPPSVLLMGSGLMGLGLLGWRRRKS